MPVDLESNEALPGDDREDQANDDADDPRGKIGADDVHAG
jgi:hypothetical protein